MVGGWFASDFHHLVAWALSVVFGSSREAKVYEIFWTKAGRVMKKR